MSEMFRQASSGDPVSGIPAATYNLFLEVAQDYLRRRSQAKPGKVSTPFDTSFRVQNKSGDILPQYSIVFSTADEVVPVNPDYFYGPFILDTSAPVAGKPFAITQEPATVDIVVPARVAGWSLCKVNITDASHTFADCTDGEYRYLTSGTTGRVEIIYGQALPAASRGATVLTGTGAPGGGLGSDGDWYTDTMAGMYYGPKASGSWGSGTASGTGVVWAVVTWTGGSGGGTGTGEEDWPVQLDDGVLVNGYYYGHTLAGTSWTSVAPCWVDDSFVGSTSLPAGEEYLSERARDSMGNPITTTGGFIYLSIASQTGDPLSTLASWIKLVKLSTPGAPIAYAPYVVTSATIAAGALTVVAGSAPTDFDSTIDYNVTDPSANIAAGTITTVGTDIDGNALTDVVTLSALGTHTYTTAAAFKTISSITIADLIGDTGGESVTATITSYPYGVVRTDSGSDYVTNTGTSGVPGVSPDWTDVTPLLGVAGWDVGTAYDVGNWLQELRPLYVIKSDPDVDTGILSINGGTATAQLITSATITITQPNNATTNIEFVGSGSTVLVLKNFGGIGDFAADHFEFQTDSPVPLSGITDFIVQVSNPSGTNALVKYLLPEADPTVQHGSITNVAQTIGGAKDFTDLATFDGELQAPGSSAQFGTQTGVVYAADVLARTQFILCAPAQPDYQNNTWNSNAVAYQTIDTWSNSGALAWDIYLAWDGTGSHTINPPATSALSTRVRVGPTGSGKCFVFQDEDWPSNVGAYPSNPFGGTDPMTGIGDLSTIPAYAIILGSLYKGAWAGLTIGMNTIPTVGGMTFAGGLYISGAPFMGAVNGGTGVDTSAVTGTPSVSGGVWSFPATLSLTGGGSGANLSATGPGVLTQATMGAVLTVVQYVAFGGTTGFTPNTSANFVFNESTFDGGGGGTAYTLNDVVAALKLAGILAL